MTNIQTINDFLRLSAQQQEELLKALRTQDRLMSWLRALSGQKKQPTKNTSKKGEWIRCPSCINSPGWVMGEAEELRDDSDIHPSAINKCIRFLWYAANGQAKHLEEHIDAKLRMIFDMGHAWHRTIQGYGEKGAWGDCGYTPEVAIDPDNPKFPLAQELWIRGHVDALLPNYYVPNVPGMGDVTVRVVHEYKTINSANYGKLTRPKPEHKWQAMIYSAVLDAPVTVYLYTNKDNCQTADFPVGFDVRLWQEIRAKIVAVQQHENAPPSWDLSSAMLNPAECRECGFRQLCNPPKRS